MSRLTGDVCRDNIRTGEPTGNAVDPSLSLYTANFFTLYANREVSGMVYLHDEFQPQCKNKHYCYYETLPNSGKGKLQVLRPKNLKWKFPSRNGITEANTVPLFLNLGAI